MPLPTEIDPPRKSSQRTSPAQAAKRGEPGRKKGTGDTGPVTVKGAPATAAQRTVINQALTQAEQDGASRRVMIALIMALTQESRMGADMRKTGNDDTGLLQQGRNWISLSGSRQAAPATHAFLVTGPTSWTKVHGSVKNAPGNLSEAIHRVQGNANANDYAPWHDEAIRTVDQWTGGEDGLEAERVVAVPYLFERGSKDRTTVENSWDASGRHAEDVNFRRWAALNTLYFVSDRELRAAAPSVEIHGDEPWLLTPIDQGWDWGSAGRLNSELTFRCLSERWGVLPGAVVLVAGNGPLDGRYLVASARDDLWGPETEVTLRRPVPPKPEPAHETTTQSSPNDQAGSDFATACQSIHDEELPYVWGGGHAHAGTPDRGTGRDPGIGYDCSGSIGAALAKAGLLITPGANVPVSGVMAASLGEPGKGREFTIWANDTHVWAELHGAGEWKRFDTSAQGSGPSGPRLRKTARTDQARFTARHVNGH
jgi:hypothetical protein